jgi:pimeloyl-ACP methyl ester carboxylesterase
MRLQKYARLAAAVGFALVLPAFTQGQPAEKGKPVVFDTVDSVKLKGTLYVSAKGKDAPTVLMLHNFEQKKGGSSQADGWQDFAKKLNGAGYNVLTFDFRGHGESTGVDAAFWSPMFMHNKMLPGAGKATPPDSISQTTFPSGYYPYLVNDIAAAKAYLDRQNDAGVLNTSSLIVIGAGEGATLGALWMESETKRRKAIIPPGALTAPPWPNCKLDEPEGKDLAAGVWLTISPTLAGKTVTLGTWMNHVGHTNKVPQVFIYGKEDTKGDAQALSLLGRIFTNGYKRGTKPEKPYEMTGEFAVPGTKLTAEKLLQKSLETDSWIIEKYLAPLIADKRGNKEPVDRQADKHMYYWFWQMGTSGRALPAFDSRISSKAPSVLPIREFGFGTP